MITLNSAILCLAMAIYNESRGEQWAVQAGVAHVVMVRSEERSKEICDVVKEPGQFPWAKNGKSLKAKENQAWFSAIELSESTISNSAKPVPTDIKGANHFWDANISPPNWSNRCVWKRRKGNLVFCKIRTV